MKGGIHCLEEGRHVIFNEGGEVGERSQDEQRACVGLNVTGNADGRVRDKDKGEMWWSEATDESGRACRMTSVGLLCGWLFAGDAG